MPLSGCMPCTGLVATALVTLLVFPAQYYVPYLDLGSNELSSEPNRFLRESNLANVTQTWLPLEIPPLDLFVTVTLIVLAMIVYACDWIQRKILERRIMKLNQYLQDSVERLQSWDARQEHLEATLNMVKNATSENNLLLYLLQRHHHFGPVARKPPSHCVSDKELDDLNFTTNPTDVYTRDVF